MITAIITMAGFGRRFADAGYKVPKYRINVHGRSLFSWAMLSLQSFIASGASFVFVVREQDDATGFIATEAKRSGIDVADVLELQKPTDGQATTALAAGSAVAAPAAPMLIYNIDTFVHPAVLPASAPRGEGWVPCFRAEGDAWSF